MHFHKRNILFVLMLLILSLMVATAPSLAGDGWQIPWWTVDSGGGESTANNYSVTGTIGQPDTATLSSGNYILTGGFWQSPGSVSPQEHLSYLPLLRR